MREILLSVLCVIVLFPAGCKVPPAPSQGQPPPPKGIDGGYGDENETGGWLLRGLRGNESAAGTPTVPPNSPAPVTPLGVAPRIQPAVPVSHSVVSTAPNLRGKTIVPAVIIEPLSEQSSEGIPMSRVSPPASVVTPPPMLPPEPPPSSPKPNQPGGDSQGFQWSDLAPENIYKNVKEATGYGPNEGIARQALREGHQLFRQKKYSEAAEKFETAASRWPDTPLEEDALFLQGESYFFSDRYPKAHEVYARLLKKYNNSRHLDIAVAREFALGRYWEQLQTARPHWIIQPNLIDGGRPLFDTFGNAMKAYQNVRMYDPLGPLADDSLMATATAYFRRNYFEEAATYFDQLRKDYPNSEHQINAHILDLQAKMRVYQGTFYDPEALYEAHTIAESTLMQFGRRLGSEQPRVAKARAQILEEKASRDFALGEYYEKKKYYGAARLYYRDLIEEYPQTAKAKEARQRLDAIKDLPDKPPNRFKWLADLLPSQEK